MPVWLQIFYKKENWFYTSNLKAYNKIYLFTNWGEKLNSMGINFFNRQKIIHSDKGTYSQCEYKTLVKI